MPVFLSLIPYYPSQAHTRICWPYLTGDMQQCGPSNSPGLLGTILSDAEDVMQSAIIAQTHNMPQHARLYTSISGLVLVKSQCITWVIT